MIDIHKNRTFILNEIKEIHKNSLYHKNVLPTLVAVSKKQEDYKIDLALLSGQLIFGENRVQEAIERWRTKVEVNHKIELHLIGPLQTNKVKDALQLFDVIETLDREKLAKFIQNKIIHNCRRFLQAKQLASIRALPSLGQYPNARVILLWKLLM